MNWIWLVVLLLGQLSACGGGGGAVEDTGTTANTTADTTANTTADTTANATASLTGQVVKGLTSGATVTLYSLTDSGQKGFIASTQTNMQGEFNLGHALQPGRVYLLEAVGGFYVNEISDIVEPLTSPMRAVFVASGSERNFAINVLSEAVAIEIEQLAEVNKWSASAVANATKLVSSAIDLRSPFDLRFVDMTRMATGNNENLSKEESSFSFQIGMFAGFLQELRLRDPSLTLAQVMKKFHAELRGGSQDDSMPSAVIAGLIRFVEKVPTLASTKFSYFSSIGLPSNSNSQQFTGAESSGQSLEHVPSWKLRFLGSPSESDQPTTDTVFNNRGSLVAYRQGATDSGAGFSHVGYASVADVFGTAETAIGRWNHGYYYQQGVTFDAIGNKFVTKNGMMRGFDRDMVYAAGIPATNMPTCGTVVMAPQAQTKKFVTYDQARQITLDASSRIAIQSINGYSLYRYNIVLRDDLGNSYAFSTESDVNASFQGLVLPYNKVFRHMHSLPLPSGESLYFHGMVAGIGGTKAVISISTNIHTASVDGIAAAFSQVSSTQDCQPVSFANGSVNSISDIGEYEVFVMGENYISATLFPNGTPKFGVSGTYGVTADSGVEKHGNNIVGIGILMPPFHRSGESAQTPQAYVYLKSYASPVLPQTGSASYRLVASTPFIVGSSNQLISANADIHSAELTVYFDQSPLGTTNQWYGTCVLTVNGQTIQPAVGELYYRGSGTCRGADALARFRGGVSGDGGHYAVIKYIRSYSSTVQGEASLIFEKNP